MFLLFFKSIFLADALAVNRQAASFRRVDGDAALGRIVILTVALVSTQAAANAQGWADFSTAATGQQGGYNTDFSWQNAVPQAAPGNADAGLGSSFATGTQGSGSINGAQLPEVNTGLNAVLSGFNKPAVRQFGSGGFSGGGAKPYSGPYGSGAAGGMLPPCAMTPCDFDVAEVGGGIGGGGGGSGINGAGDNYGYHGGNGGSSFSGGGDNYGYHGGGGSGGDAYSFHGGN